MILDKELVFSLAQAKATGVFDSAAAFDSTNIVNLGASGDRLDNLNLVIRVDTTVVGSSSTVAFTLETCATIGGSYVPLISVPAIAEATLVAGYVVFKGRVPRTGVLQFLKVVYTVGTAGLTAGKFDAFLTPEIDTNLANAT